MKKIIVVLCVLTMVFCGILCGCGKKKDEGGSTAENAAVNLAESQYTGKWMAVKAEFSLRAKSRMSMKSFREDFI